MCVGLGRMFGRGVVGWWRGRRLWGVVGGGGRGLRWRNYWSGRWSDSSPGGFGSADGNRKVDSCCWRCGCRSELHEGVCVCVPCEAQKEGLGVRYHCLVSCSDRCRWHFCEEVC